MLTPLACVIEEAGVPMYDNKSPGLCAKDKKSAWCNLPEGKNTKRLTVIIFVVKVKITISFIKKGDFWCFYN